MSIIIRSNTLATNTLGNIHDMQGPDDFSGIFNFERKLFQIGRDIVDFKDAIQFSRDSVGGYTDFDGEYRIAGVDEPRFHKLDTGRGGLLLMPPSTNLLSAPDNPLSQTVQIPHTSSAWTHVFLKVWGPGSATISFDESVVEGTSVSRVAREGDPCVTILAPGADSAPATVTVDGQLTRFELTRYNSNQWGASLNPRLPDGVTTASEDFAEVNRSLVGELLNRESGTIVMAYSREPRLATGGSLQCQWGSLVNDNPRGGLYVGSSAATSMSATGYSAGSSSPAFTYNMAKADGNSTTVAISWEDYGAVTMLANNGIVHVDNRSFELPEINRFTFAAILPGQRSTPNAVLTHALTYRRALSQSELQQVTSNWR